MDFETANELIKQENENLSLRVKAIEDKGIADDRISMLKKKLALVDTLTSDSDAEKTQEAQERLLESKKLLSQVRRAHLQEIRQMELDSCTKFFDDHLKAHARPSEQECYNSLKNTAQRYIDGNF